MVTRGGDDGQTAAIASEDTGQEADDGDGRDEPGDGSGSNGNGSGGTSNQGVFSPGTSRTDDDGDAATTTSTSGRTSTTATSTTSGPTSTDGPSSTTTEPTTTTSEATTTTRPVTSTIRETTTTSRPTTTSSSITSTTQPTAVPIRIVSGPSVNTVGPRSFQFNYGTNDVCGTGSFSVVDKVTGVTKGSFTGENICYGPLHGGYPAGQPSGVRRVQPGAEHHLHRADHGAGHGLPTGCGPPARAATAPASR